jgi:glycosyltransferase involved in cell wall biosynthesis
MRDSELASVIETQPPDFSIVVPTRNRSGILDAMLRCLKAQTLGAERFEVIVLDDASGDQTWQVLENHTCHMANLRPHRFERPCGTEATCFIAHLRNEGLRQARGRIFVSLDDDSLVRPDFLERLRRVHTRAGQALVTGPIVDVTTVPDHPFADFEGRVGWHRNPIPGCNFSLPVQMLEDIGGFDESFMHYGWEDLELFERLTRRGFRRVYAREVGIFHAKTPAIRGSFADQLRQEMHRGTMGRYFYQKHPRFRIGLITKQLSPLRGLSRLLDRLFDLDERTLAVARGETPPAGPAFRALLREHAEISADFLLPQLRHGLNNR